MMLADRTTHRPTTTLVLVLVLGEGNDGIGSDVPKAKCHSSETNPVTFIVHSLEDPATKQAKMSFVRRACILVSATLLCLGCSSSAFTPPATSLARPSGFGTSALFSTTQSEVERLRAAAKAAREEYEKLSREMGKEVASSGDMQATATAAVESKELSVDEVKALAASIEFTGGDAASQSEKLDGLVDSGDLSLWKSAVRRGPTSSTSNMSLLVPFPVTLETLERRSDGKVTGESLGIGGEGDVKFEEFQDLTVAVVLGSTLMGILSLAVLPENIGATVTYLFALIPVGFIGIGSTSPGIIAAAIKGSRGDSEDAEQQRERICRHEAGHFLCGWLCGLPIKSYNVNDDTGVACVEFHTGGAGQELSDEEIASLSVVAMSGSVAEILNFDVAKGGENDLLELQVSVS